MRSLGHLAAAMLLGALLTSTLIVVGWAMGRAARAPLSVVCRCAP